MVLKLNKNICLDKVKQDLERNVNRGNVKNNYSFEVNLIFKIIHEYSNYENYQWQLYCKDKSFVEMEIKSLLLDISLLDKNLAWDCISILSRYKNAFKKRHLTAKKYIRCDI